MLWLPAGAVLIGWGPAKYANAYRIYWGTNAGDYQFEMDVGTNLSARLLNLNPECTYFIAITAYNEFGESDFSVPLIWTEPIHSLVVTINLQTNSDLAGPWHNAKTMTFTNLPSDAQTFYRAFLTITNQ